MAIIERTRVAAAPQVRPRRRGGWRKALAILGLTLLAVVLLAAGALAYLVYNPLPATSGTLSLQGLSAPVTVVRDKSGIPHITAANSADLFRAQGYVVAQDRLWQMDFYRRVGSGRLSEILGRRTLDADRATLTMGWRRAAERDLAALPPQYQAILQQYADGVNAFLESHADALPVEFTVLGYKPAHWTPLDTVTFGKVMAWDLSENHGLEVTVADLQAKLGPERAMQLLPGYPGGAPTIAPQSALPGRAEGRHIPALLSGVFGDPTADGGIGSNNWVVAGAKTVDGRPLLANDPHLSVQNPSIWYAMGLQASDGSLDVEGVTFAGAPGIVVGHNANIAWGVTNLGPDTQDFFVEKLDPAAHPGQYEYQGTWRPLDVVTETIPVKGEAAVQLTVQSTVHGPLVQDVFDGLGAPTAMQWTALQGDMASAPDAPQAGRLLPAVIAVDQAADWDAFHAALRGWDVPGQNFVYADTKGNIGYQATGRWPIRKAGTGLVPVDGATGANDWTGYVPYEQMPRVYNPPEHFLVTANNRVVGPDYPYLVNGWWGPWFRAERITQMLTAKDKLSVDDIKAIQYDTHNILAAAVGKHLAALQGGDAPTQQAAALFQNWDGNISLDGPQAAIYEITRRQIVTDTLVDDLGGVLADEYLSNASHGSNMLLYTLLDDPTNAWWDNQATPQHETRDDILRQALSEAVSGLSGAFGTDMGKWSWGAMHKVTFAHRLGVSPLNVLLNFGPYSTPGDNYTVAAAGGSTTSAEPYAYSQTGHPSMRLIMDVGAWDNTQLVFSPGESGQPGSAHWGDQVAGWLHGEYRTVPWSAAQIQQAAEGTLTLQP
ncbi:MAG TPA: penicillin acylase family protein [Chloroflexia bacterium]|nr:penicillin acylase family protein [Chloroflexia bacterium]